MMKKKTLSNVKTDRRIETNFHLYDAALSGSAAAFL